MAKVIDLAARRPKPKRHLWALAGVGHVLLEFHDGHQYVLTPKQARALAFALQTLADTVEQDGGRSA